MLLHPAFEFQDRLQRKTLGYETWIEIARVAVGRRGRFDAARGDQQTD